VARRRRLPASDDGWLKAAIERLPTAQLGIVVILALVEWGMVNGIQNTKDATTQHILAIGAIVFAALALAMVMVVPRPRAGEDRQLDAKVDRSVPALPTVDEYKDIAGQ
jgi:hypothetical protein